jgi:hypothetical protein
MTRPRFLWQVYGFSDTHRRETVASFFESTDAEELVRNSGEIGFERRNLYCAEPKYDRRESGYRPVRGDIADIWGAGLTECRSDPLLKSRRAA